MILIKTLALVVLFSGSSAAVAQIDEFSGRWNATETGGVITALDIAHGRSGLKMTVHWQCSNAPCQKTTFKAKGSTYSLRAFATRPSDNLAAKAVVVRLDWHPGQLKDVTIVLHKAHRGVMAGEYFSDYFESDFRTDTYKRLVFRKTR